mmetsp:Transcript_24328/g.60321  ORF Transcript_24328/g.60321 Transcript_24328/m.60321 type:complete len:239 (+) Transcript_24328:544-1260(+)
MQGVWEEGGLENNYSALRRVGDGAFTDLPGRRRRRERGAAAPHRRRASQRGRRCGWFPPRDSPGPRARRTASAPREQGWRPLRTPAQSAGRPPPPKARRRGRAHRSPSPPRPPPPSPRRTSRARGRSGMRRPRASRSGRCASPAGGASSSLCVCPSRSGRSPARRVAGTCRSRRRRRGAAASVSCCLRLLATAGRRWSFPPGAWRSLRRRGSPRQHSARQREGGRAGARSPAARAAAG